MCTSRVRGAEGERERERESQADSFIEHWGLISGHRNHDLSRNQELDALRGRHPGTPT